MDEFPEDYEKFCFIKDTILDCKDYAILGIKCKVCGHMTNHNFHNCPIISL